jgi:enoyl-CoA hydratase/carnithine racemase
MIELTRHDDVFVLHLGEGDIRFGPSDVADIDAALEDVEAHASPPCALVTHASGKIWHNGLDLDHLATLGDDLLGYLADVQRLLGRYLTLPVPTVAAIQGHAFAAGAMLALAHDVRVMRADRGYLCLPEIDLGMSFTDGMAGLIAGKLSQPGLHRLAVLGERVGGGDAADLGLVDEAVDGEEAVLPAALTRATALAPKASSTLAVLRRNLYGPAIDALLG